MKVITSRWKNNELWFGWCSFVIIKSLKKIRKLHFEKSSILSITHLKWLKNRQPERISLDSFREGVKLYLLFFFPPRSTLFHLLWRLTLFDGTFPLKLLPAKLVYVSVCAITLKFCTCTTHQESAHFSLYFVHFCSRDLVRFLLCFFLSCKKTRKMLFKYWINGNSMRQLLHFHQWFFLQSFFPPLLYVHHLMTRLASSQSKHYVQIYVIAP